MATPSTLRELEGLLGLCGHQPTGKEVHSIRLPGSLLYVSGNGLISDIVDEREVKRFNEASPPALLQKGGVFGLRHDARDSSISFFYDGAPLGQVRIKLKKVKEIVTRYPVFGMYIPDSTIQAKFDVLSPSG